MEEIQEQPVRVLLAAVDWDEVDRARSMEELAALAESNGMLPVATVVQKKEKPEGATYLGIGRLEEAAQICRNLEVQTCIFDDELTGVQLRNLEEKLGVPVMDRTMLILEIFANRAVTSEGKLQTELARLHYRLPRLIGLGSELSRQGGGGGGGSGARRGAGESQLEYDRRYIRGRIELLKKKLDELDARRSQTRRSRQKSGVPVIALVGYTNVGKSTLLNRLCGAEVLTKDQLFATLDPTARRCTLPSGLNAIFVDTVGFVSRLPHNLVDAFKSTLEEAAYADVLLKLCDVSDPESQTQLEVTDGVLAQLGCSDIPQLTVYNKCDGVNAAVLDRDALCVSAKTGQGLDKLLARLDAMLADRVCPVEVLLPYDKIALAAVMRDSGTLAEEEYREGGLYCRGTVRREDYHLFAPYCLSAEERPE